MTTPHSLPLSLSEIWEDFRFDVERQASAFTDEGWKTEIFTVGEVRPISSPETPGASAGPGLRALIPDNHFELFARLVDEGSEYRCDVYKRSVREEAVFILLVYKFQDEETALFIPLFYRLDDAKAMLETAETQGTLITEFRPLDNRNTITLQHEDPTLFFPDER